MNDIRRDSGLLIKGVKNETKKQKGGLLTCYQSHQVPVYQEICQKEKGVLSSGKGTIRSGQDF